MIFHHPPLRRRIYLFFAWLEGNFSFFALRSLTGALSAREWNKPEPNNKRGASAPPRSAAGDYVWKPFEFRLSAPFVELSTFSGDGEAMENSYIAAHKVGRACR